jgi:hypothetical protein
MNEPEEFDPDKVNEKLLKTAAITFSLEGMSKDLEIYMQKKITLNNRNLKHISDIIRSLSSCGVEVQKNLLRNGSPLSKMLEHTAEEMSGVNTLLTYVLEKIISKEILLNSDLDQNTEIDDVDEELTDDSNPI